jgi:hypothetical protein
VLRCSTSHCATLRKTPPSCVVPCRPVLQHIVPTLCCIALYHITHCVVLLYGSAGISLRCTSLHRAALTDTNSCRESSAYITRRSNSASKDLYPVQMPRPTYLNPRRY